MARWFPLLYQCHLQGVSYSSYLENGFSTIVSCHNPPPPPRSSLSPCLIGTGLLSQWRCVQIQLVCVMLCCLVLHSNGRSGQESSWTHTHTCAHTDTHTHTGKRKVFPETHYSFPSLPYCLCLSENRSRWRKICAVVSPWSSIQAPLKAFSVMTNSTFPFPSNPKCHRSKGLSLNLQLLDLSLNCHL